MHNSLRQASTVVLASPPSARQHVHFKFIPITAQEHFYSNFELLVTSLHPGSRTVLEHLTNKSHNLYGKWSPTLVRLQKAVTSYLHPEKQAQQFVVHLIPPTSPQVHSTHSPGLVIPHFSRFDMHENVAFGLAIVLLRPRAVQRSRDPPPC